MLNFMGHKLQETPLYHSSRPHMDEGWYVNTMEALVTASKSLSLARNMNAVTAIVRKTARQLTNADGATFTWPKPLSQMIKKEKQEIWA